MTAYKKRSDYLRMLSANGEGEPGEGRRRLSGGVIACVIVAVLLVILLASFASLALFTSFFDVKSITVSGLGEQSEEEIIKASGINPGVSILALDGDAAEKNILAAFPEILDASVEKTLPGSVDILLTYDVPKYFICVTGEYFTVSEELRVIKRGGARKDHEASELIYLTVPNLKRAVTGDTLGFFKEDEEYIIPFLDTLKGSFFGDKIDRIYIDNKFDISLVSTGRFKIEMGDFRDQELKLKMAEKVFETGGYGAQIGVVIDVSDAYESSVRVDKNLIIE